MDTDYALSELQAAASAGKLSSGAVQNIRQWLTESPYAEFVPQIVEHMQAGKWAELDDAFWTIIPFGTGGRRGRMYPIGSAMINQRTIGESAQGLADYVKRHHGDTGSLTCAIAYDTRHRSREFAELCAEVMVAAGMTVHFLDGYRSTPELSFAVRFRQCACGIMVTASHNPPSDNAVKVYWSTGGQILPPHDQGVIDQVMNTAEIHRVPFQQAVDSGKVHFCQDEVDQAFVQAAAGEALPGPRDVKIVYSPLHGVGASAVCPVLAADGFTDVELFGPHAEPDGDFPNVPDHVANPENPRVFDAIIDRARQIGADMVMASDPDCDRIGCAAPLTTKPGAPWATLSGNQIGALLADFVLGSRASAGQLSPHHYVVKTIVTTELIRRIADHYSVTTYGNLMVGFKWIGGLIDDVGPEKFVFAAEESHGYQVGTYTRDKDAAVAAMLLAELAAQLKSKHRTLHEQLDELYEQYGVHAEQMFSVTLPGSEGMAKIEALMGRFRSAPPAELAGAPVVRVRDYLSQTATPVGGTPQPLDGPRGNLILLDLQPEGNFVAVRPSGTEPKVKFYLFGYQPSGDLPHNKSLLADRLAAIQRDLSGLAEA